MIIVDIRVPALEKVYNLSLDEKAPVEDLIEEIVELVLQKERVTFQGKMSEMILGSVDQGIQCNKSSCLSDYGIVSGEELILV